MNNGKSVNMWPLKWNAAFHLRAWHDPTGAWLWNRKLMQAQANRDLEMVWLGFLGAFIKFFTQFPAHEQNFKNMDKWYIIVFVSSCTSSKQQLFSLIQTHVNKSNNRRSNNQSLNHNISINTWWNSTIQSSLYSWQQDLQEA